MSTRLVPLAALALASVVAACTGAGTTPTNAPVATGTPAVVTSAPATVIPATQAPATADPEASLDPSQSDDGIAARVTISNDTRNGLDGTHDIYGVADDGSECNGSFEEPGYLVVAWYDDAPNGMIRRFSINVAAAAIPAADGTASDIADGGVSFDFASESGFGTTYTGASQGDDEGSSMIDVTRSGSGLTFDFEGVTFDGINFAGQLICADSSN